MMKLLVRLDWQEVGPSITIAMKANGYYRELDDLKEAGYYDFN